MKAFHINFRRTDWKEPGEVRAELHLEGNQGKTRIYKFSFDFNCIPYLQRDLAKLWEPERQQRQASLDRISKSLGGN